MAKNMREVTGIWLRQRPGVGSELLIESGDQWWKLKTVYSGELGRSWPMSEIIEMCDSNFQKDTWLDSSEDKQK